MPDDKCREAVEGWVKKTRAPEMVSLLLERHARFPNFYLADGVQYKWEAWRACWEYQDSLKPGRPHDVADLYEEQPDAE
jgi:hypothetical protein